MSEKMKKFLEGLAVIVGVLMFIVFPEWLYQTLEQNGLVWLGCLIIGPLSIAGLIAVIKGKN